MYRIEKTFDFSAAHALKGLDFDHPCSRMHGHNYVVKLILESPTLGEVGFVRDYRELDAFKKFVDETFDHQIVNDVLEYNPTAENMARFFYNYAHSFYPEIAAVGVSETPKTWAWYSPESLTLEVLEQAIEELPQPHRSDFQDALRRSN